MEELDSLNKIISEKDQLIADLKNHIDKLTEQIEKQSNQIAELNKNFAMFCHQSEIR